MKEEDIVVGNHETAAATESPEPGPRAPVTRETQLSGGQGSLSKRHGPGVTRWRRAEPVPRFTPRAKVSSRQFLGPQLPEGTAEELLTRACSASLEKGLQKHSP